MGFLGLTNKEAPVPRLSEQQVRDTLREFDTNQDGQLSWEEIKKAFNHLGALVPAYRAGVAMWKADANGDGYVSMSEMNDLVAYVYKLGYTVK